MKKQDLWPKEGKMKKGLIILAIVITGALLITLVEEKSTLHISKKVPFVIAMACLGVWVYTPSKKEKQ